MAHNNANTENTQQIEGRYDDHVGTIYRASGNLLIVKQCCKTEPKIFSAVTRSEITCFSAGSGIRMRRYLRECLAEYTWMVTLTYPGIYSQDGRVIKNHLRRFLQEVKREWKRKALINCLDECEFSAFWFLEFQQRGAPHFHIFLTWAPDREWVSRRWYEIVGSEDERHLRAGTRVEYLHSGRAGTISYASKYAAKMEQKEVPAEYKNVGRWWGVVGRRGRVSAATWVSVGDIKKTNVKQALNRLIRCINRYLLEGTLELWIKGEGVRVFTSNSEQVMRALRFYIGGLAATTCKWENIFDDADIED